MSVKGRRESRIRRKKRVRKKVRGTPEKPRLSVFRSSANIYAQIIDDHSARTLADASSLSKDIRSEIKGKGGNREGAALVGKAIAKRALEHGVTNVVFDRNGFLYHGRIKVLADAARESGLVF